MAPPPELPIATVELPLPPPAAPLRAPRPPPTASAAAPPAVEDRGEGLLVLRTSSSVTGRPAESGNTVAVHYVGTLEDHTEFDNSRARKRPFEVELGKGMVIKGWERGIPGMRVGGKRRLTIPPDLAYGARATRPNTAELDPDLRGRADRREQEVNQGRQSLPMASYANVVSPGSVAWIGSEDAARVEMSWPIVPFIATGQFQEAVVALTLPVFVSAPR